MQEDTTNGFFWPSFFLLSKDDVKNIRQCSDISLETFYSRTMYHYVKCSKEEGILALEQALLFFLFKIEEMDFAKEILGEEDYQKALECYERRQFNNKNIQLLLNKFCSMLYYKFDYGCDKEIISLLKVPFLSELKKVRETNLEKEYGPLKNVLKQVTAGVHMNCFNEVEGKRMRVDIRLDQDLVMYIFLKYAYDFTINYEPKSLFIFDIEDEIIEARYRKMNSFMQYFLFDNADFWEKHKNFNILKFINQVKKYNDVKHAKNIITFIFENAMKSSLGKKIIKHSYPFAFFKDTKYRNNMEWRSFHFTFERFSKKYDLGLIENSICCYPLNEVDEVEEKLKIGKQVTNQMFQMIYLEDYMKVMEFIENALETNDPLFIRKKFTMKDVLDFVTFGFYKDFEMDKRYIKDLCPEFFSKQNVLNRLYLKGYYFKVLTGSVKQATRALFEVYYDELFTFINTHFHLSTSFQKDDSIRNNTFDDIKRLLSQYNFKLNEKFKDFYVISQLDRKSATYCEAQKFPVLEQLGDAIYGLAVAELLFYNPSNEGGLTQLFQEYTSAKIQVDISKKIGLSNLYISPLLTPQKYTYEELIFTNDQYLSQKANEEAQDKYLADSLEMLIGAICKEFGYLRALDFSKQILKESYPNLFNEEIHWKDCQEEITEYFWEERLPIPYTHQTSYQGMMWNALNKFLLSYILGTERKETRNFITKSSGQTEIYGKECSYNKNLPIFNEYAYNDVDYVIKKYGNIIKENYSKLSKEN